MHSMIETSLAAIRTDALDIAYEVTGPVGGPAVVLLHGFPYDVRAFDQVVPALAAAGCRVIVPYLRGYGPTRFVDAARPRSGQQGALGADLRDLLVALDLGPVVLAGYDWGGRAACIVAALWPELVRGLVTVGGYNIQNIAASVHPLPPEYEYRFWYQYYFHSGRGREGLRRNRRELTRLLWTLWSPTWWFDDDTFDRTAGSFENPDFVDVVVHSYRHRFGLVGGDPAYDSIEARLATNPVISVPTIVLLGADDGVDPPESEDDGDAETIEPGSAGDRGAPPDEFADLRDVRLVADAGHNLPQEQPHAVVAAVKELLV
jgi:pimeloyl-ACP methyl ester carboxylesterase